MKFISLTFFCLFAFSDSQPYTLHEDYHEGTKERYLLFRVDLGNYGVQNQSPNLTVLPNESISIKGGRSQQENLGKDLGNN